MFTGTLVRKLEKVNVAVYIHIMKSPRANFAVTPLFKSHR